MSSIDNKWSGNAKTESTYPPKGLFKRFKKSRPATGEEASFSTSEGCSGARQLRRFLVKQRNHEGCHPSGSGRCFLCTVATRTQEKHL